MTMRVLVLGLLLCGAARAGAGDLQKRFKAAFKPLRLPGAAQVEKTLRPMLPPGIVIEADPFDAVILRFLQPWAAQFEEREKVMRALGEPSAPPAAGLLRSACRTLSKEDADLHDRIRKVEEEYAEVYNRGWMESGEKARRTRKTAAVLIPAYRSILARNRAARDAGLAAVARLKEGKDLEWLLTALATERDPYLSVAVARALPAVGGDAARAALEGAVARHGNGGVRAAALAALFSWKTSEIRQALLGAVADPAWQVRALAVAACARAKLVEAAGPMIAQLEKEEGRLRTDIDDALFALFGVRMYGDVDLWKSWLASNRDNIASRAKRHAEAGDYDRPLGPPTSWEAGEAEREDEKKREGATTAFYGIVTKSKRIVYVIDISRSMQDAAQKKPTATSRRKDPYPAPRSDSKIDLAKWQLHRAVHDLPKDAVFNIIVYSESYKVWHEEMAPASRSGKKKAHQFIDGLNGNGTTNICDSLDAAFALAGVGNAPDQLAADTIYLLSDGDPNRGRLSDLTALLDDVLARTAIARIVFHTVGIGEAAGSAFLESLAKRTGGYYVGFP